MAGEVKLRPAQRALHDAARATSRLTTRRWWISACVTFAVAIGAAVTLDLAHQPLRALLGPTHEESVKATAHMGVQLFLSRSWNKLAKLYTPASIFKEPATGVRKVGAAAIVGELKRWHERYGGLSGTVLSTHVSGDTAVLHMAWDGRQTEPTRTPDGTHLPVGAQVTLTSWVLIVVRDGKITSTEHSLNPDELASPTSSQLAATNLP